MLPSTGTVIRPTEAHTAQPTQQARTEHNPIKAAWETVFPDSISLFTAALFLATIALWLSTRKLWLAGEKQLAHSEDTARRQLRAYLDFDGVKWRRRPTHDEPGQVATGIFSRIKNYGQTPANDLVVEVRYFIQDTTGVLHAVTADGTDGPVIYRLGSIAPSDHTDRNSNFPMPEIMWEALASNNIAFISDIKVSYKDTFDKPHILECQFRSQGTSVRSPHTFIEGTRKSD